MEWKYGNGKKKRNWKKILMDYTRWVFKLDSCTPRCDFNRARNGKVKDRMGNQGKEM